MYRHCTTHCTAHGTVTSICADIHHDVVSPLKRARFSVYHTPIGYQASCLSETQFAKHVGQSTCCHHLRPCVCNVTRRCCCMPLHTSKIHTLLQSLVLGWCMSDCWEATKSSCAEISLDHDARIDTSITEPRQSKRGCGQRVDCQRVDCKHELVFTKCLPIVNMSPVLFLTVSPAKSETTAAMFTMSRSCSILQPARGKLSGKTCQYLQVAPTLLRGFAHGESQTLREFSGVRSVLCQVCCPHGHTAEMLTRNYRFTP